MSAGAPILAFDFASPRASVAVAAGDDVMAACAVTRLEGEPQLLALIDSTISDAGLEVRQLGGVVALAGPGSFTGLRVACATAIGLGQALGIPVGGVSTLEVLAGAAGSTAEVLAAVDALRGEWFVQPFRPTSGATPVADGEIRLWKPGDELPAVGHVSGFDSGRFVGSAGLEAERSEPENLAAVAAKLPAAPGWTWRPDLLAHPLYLRAPATTRPRR